MKTLPALFVGLALIAAVPALAQSEPFFRLGIGNAGPATADPGVDAGDDEDPTLRQVRGNLSSVPASAQWMYAGGARGG